MGRCADQCVDDHERAGLGSAINRTNTNANCFAYRSLYRSPTTTPPPWTGVRIAIYFAYPDVHGLKGGGCLPNGRCWTRGVIHKVSFWLDGFDRWPLRYISWCIVSYTDDLNIGGSIKLDVLRSEKARLPETISVSINAEMFGQSLQLATVRYFYSVWSAYQCKDGKLKLHRGGRGPLDTSLGKGDLILLTPTVQPRLFQ